MFADDKKIWTRLTNPVDAESLQKDLDSLSTWSARWQLKFNPEKCKLMHIGHKQDTKYTIRQDNINRNIQEVSEERDLSRCTNDMYTEGYQTVPGSSIESKQNSGYGAQTVQRSGQEELSNNL